MQQSVLTQIRLLFLSKHQGMKALSMHFAGFQNDEKAFRVGQPYRLLQRIHLLIAACT